MTTRRRGGLGVEIGPGVVRAVRVAPGRSAPAATAEQRVDEHQPDAVLRALVEVTVAVGTPAGCPARLAWTDPGTRLRSVDVTDATPAALAELFRQWSDDGDDAVTVLERRSRRWAIRIRWDGAAASALSATAERAGLGRTPCEPAALAVARLAGRDDEPLGGAHAAALAAAGAVPARPLRRLRSARSLDAPVASVWVVEAVAEPEAASSGGGAGPARTSPIRRLARRLHDIGRRRRPGSCRDRVRYLRPPCAC